MKSIGYKITLIICTIIFVAGLYLFLYPYITSVESNIKSEKAISNYVAQISNISTGKNPLLDKLYSDIQEYNRRIYLTKQDGLKDQESYVKPIFNMKNYGIDSDIFGYIEIDSIGVKLPIYLGASQKNMALGAVHLTYTSLPIDQNNTNVVIAAHRGFRGAAFFRNINRIKIGDTINIINPWGNIRYKVYKTLIVRKNEIDKIYIKDNKKILTLSSCHPYTKNTHRYLVYAEMAE